MLLQKRIIFINPTSILGSSIFIQRKSATYKEFFALMQSLFPLRKDYFHQNNIHSEIIHCILFKGESCFHFRYIMIFSLISLPKRTAPKWPAPTNHVPPWLNLQQPN